MKSNGKPAKSLRPLQSPRGKSSFKTFCSSPSFDDSERSTLPSAIHSGFSTARQLILTPRTPRTVAESLPPLQRELEQLDLLQSLLLQWRFVNAMGQRTQAVLTRKVEEEIFDRGMQVADLQEGVLREVSDLRERDQTRLLTTVLEMETKALESVESDVQKTAEFLQQIQSAGKAAVNRIPLQGDSAALLESLRCAEHSLERVHDFVAGEEGDTLALVDPCKRLAEVVAEEREEVINSYILITELRKLFDLERQAITAKDQSI